MLISPNFIVVVNVCVDSQQANPDSRDLLSSHLSSRNPTFLICRYLLELVILIFLMISEADHIYYIGLFHSITNNCFLILSFVYILLNFFADINVYLFKLLISLLMLINYNLLTGIRHKRDRFWKSSMCQTENIGFLPYSDCLPIDFLPLFPKHILSTLMKNLILTEVNQNHWQSHSKNYPLGKLWWSKAKLPSLLFQLQSLRDQDNLTVKNCSRN